VKVYSNANEVELLLNGVSQGGRSNATNCVFVWKNVELKPGENRVATQAQRGGHALSDECVWTFKPTAEVRNR
jgi:hypothetical protein